MLELVYKANAILDLVSPFDTLKLFEMSINKTDIMRNQILINNGFDYS